MVLNCRLRYALDPSRIARQIATKLSGPLGSLSRYAMNTAGIIAPKRPMLRVNMSGSIAPTARMELSYNI
jgi:hypothetical protein